MHFFMALRPELLKESESQDGERKYGQLKVNPERQNDMKLLCLKSQISRHHNLCPSHQTKGGNCSSKPDQETHQAKYLSILSLFILSLILSKNKKITDKDHYLVWNKRYDPQKSTISVSMLFLQTQLLLSRQKQPRMTSQRFVLMTIVTAGKIPQPSRATPKLQALAQTSPTTLLKAWTLIITFWSPVNVLPEDNIEFKVFQLWQLQSFQIMQAKQRSVPGMFIPLIHIQWALKAQPQTTVLSLAPVLAMATFQAGCQRPFKRVEMAWATPSIQVTVEAQLIGLLLMTVWISVMLSSVMLPVPCQAPAERAGTVRASSRSRKLSLWLELRLMLANYYKAQQAIKV